MKSTPARRPRRPVDTPTYLSMLQRMIAAGGGRVADGDPEDLAQLLQLHEELDEAVLQAVTGLRDAGTTWQDIGDALGTTRQAAILRWAHKI